MSCFEDEIQGLVLDIKRYSMGDARIEFCLEEMLKRIRAEVDALAFEAALLTRATTEAENARIREASHSQTVRWVGNDY